MKLPDNIPAGVRTTLQRMEKSIKTNQLAVVQQKDTKTGEIGYLFCSVEIKNGEAHVTALAEVYDATLPTDSALIDDKSTAKTHWFNPKTGRQS